MTSEDLFAGLSFENRLEACIKFVDGKANQFINETSILLDMARSGAEAYVSCEAENETDICAFLAQLDMEVKEASEHFMEKLREL